MEWHHRQVGGQDTHGVFKAPIKSRPAGRLVHVPGEELDRQINIKAPGQSHNEGQARSHSEDISIMRVTPPINDVQR